jgi:transposase-like protein
LCRRGDRTVRQVSQDFDLTETAVREWVKQAELDTGTRTDGLTSDERAKVNAQVALKNANFPNGTDLESRIQRFEKTLSAIQDLKCPAASTTLLGRLNSLTALRANANRDNILRGLGLNETPAG